MDRLIYTSLSSMRSSMARQTTTANNLANANTIGFRAEIARTGAMWMKGTGYESRAPAGAEVVASDMSSGAFFETGNPMDVAMNGEAMLAVQSPDGDEAYTRRGDLKMQVSGLLTTGDGNPVIGEDGSPITLPPSDSMSIDQSGAVWIVPVGGEAANAQKVAQLKLATPTGSDIVKGLDGLFRVDDGGALPMDPEASVTTGTLEQSNVNATQTLIDMIDQSRSWDTQIKLLTTAKDIDTATADLMRLPA